MTKYFKAALPLALASAALGATPMAHAEIMLYEQEGTTFTTDGYINAFFLYRVSAL